MNVEHFLEEREKAWTTLGSLVTAAMRQYGPSLFPQDNGQRYRYYFMRFPYSFLESVTRLLSQKPGERLDDKWVLRTKHVILKLDVFHLVRLIGFGHLYSESLHIHGDYSPADRRQIAWVQGLLCGIYDFNDAVAQQWADVTADAPDIKYLIKEASLIYYNHVARLLLLDVGDTENLACWNGLFLEADFLLRSRCPRMDRCLRSAVSALA